MSGGLPRLDIGAGDSRSRVSAMATPVVSDEQKALNIADAQRRVDLEAQRKQAAALLPKDLADMAIKDSMSGKVRKARAGSMADSLIGQWAGFLVLVGIVGMGWVRAVLRGDVW